MGPMKGWIMPTLDLDCWDGGRDFPAGLGEEISLSTAACKGGHGSATRIVLRSILVKMAAD
eukprot:3437050-Amphidinium_carterae.1